MAIKQVKVVQVDAPVKGRTVLQYVGTDGTTWKIGALESKLDDSSKSALKAAKAGDTITIEVLKDGNYWNLTRIGDGLAAEASTIPKQWSGSKTSYTSPGTTVKGKDVDTRIQVMNALTNAVVSLGAGKTIAEYEKRVVEFVALGSKITKSILEGGAEVTSSSPKAEASKPDPVETLQQALTQQDDDIDF